MITNRFGGNTQICMKTNTVIMSYENHLFTQLIINGFIEDFDIQASSKDSASTNRGESAQKQITKLRRIRQPEKPSRSATKTPKALKIS
mmetsp:Transcript_9933/g.13522  ORF Transcript_9933/g.13522 Transcript_9933/m.13522 type:complete len:89 (+) Transcript_9933:1148-1414(+)